MANFGSYPAPGVMYSVLDIPAVAGRFFGCLQMSFLYLFPLQVPFLMPIIWQVYRNEGPTFWGWWLDDDSSVKSKEMKLVIAPIFHSGNATYISRWWLNKVHLEHGDLIGRWWSGNPMTSMTSVHVTLFRYADININLFLFQINVVSPSPNPLHLSAILFPWFIWSPKAPSIHESHALQWC